MMPKRLLLLSVFLLPPLCAFCDQSDTLILNRMIDDYEFENHMRIRGVQLGKQAVSVGEYAFFGCCSMQVADLFYVRHIGGYAFQNTALKQVDVSSATHIGDFAFAGCNMLRSVFFGYDVSELGDFVFHRDSALVDVALSSGRIGSGAFASCCALTCASLRTDSSEVDSIGVGLFMNCTSLKQVYLPCSLSMIPPMTFMGCISLSEIEIPPYVNTIGEQAFAQSGLEEVSIPQSVKHICRQAFAQCPHLRRVIIHNNEIEIDTTAFDPSVELCYVN